MKTKWGLILGVCLFLLLPVIFAKHEGTVVQAQTAPTPCPQCFSDMGRLPGHGDAGGRRTINIYLGAGWDSAEQRAHLEEALTCARTAWNTTNDYNGRGLLYDLQVTTTQAQADIVIEGGATDDGCAQNNVGSYPNTVTMGPTTRANPVANVCSTLEHEIGHSLGLDQDDRCVSVMNSSGAGCTTTRRELTPNDIFRVNQHVESPQTCTSTLGGGGPEVDPCNGDPCCGDPCCNDPDCGDPCAGDPYCNTYCYDVCEYQCGDNETCVWDDPCTPGCDVFGNDICWWDCHQECY
jgi:hypothetical protein